MADYNTPETRTLWGDLLDQAERESDNPAWIQFAARSYRRECMHAADEAVARLEADRDFRPSIMDCCRTYDEWQAALLYQQRLLDLGIELSTYRENLDAQTNQDRLYRIANVTRAAWEANMEKQRAERDANRGHSVRRVKATPAKYVRGADGTKILRSMSHA